MFARIGNRQDLPVHSREVVLLPRILPPGGEALIHARPAKDPAHLLRRGDCRRLVGELVADVHIEGPVIAPELPAGGHVDGVEGDLVRVQYVGQLRRTGVEFEIPVPVETEDFFGPVALLPRFHRLRGGPVGIGDKVTAARQFVLLKDLEGAEIGFVQLIPHDAPPLSGDAAPPDGESAPVPVSPALSPLSCAIFRGLSREDPARKAD